MSETSRSRFLHHNGLGRLPRSRWDPPPTRLGPQLPPVQYLGRIGRISISYGCAPSVRKPEPARAPSVPGTATPTRGWLPNIHVPRPLSNAEAMAAVFLPGNLQDEATCSVCLEFFKDPVSIECGHNFCRACIVKSWKDLEADFPCPQCREVFQQRSFRPNRQLANMAEIIGQFALRGAKGAEDEGLCPKHREALKLFCKDDRRSICVVCDRSRDHRPHAVVPVDEAAEEYKEKIQCRLDVLKKERQELLEFKVNDDKKTQELLRTIASERQKLLLEFEKLRQFLQEQERLLLAQLDKMESNVGRRQNDNITDLSREIALLNKLIAELEEKIQQPMLEFLKERRRAVPKAGASVHGHENARLQFLPQDRRPREGPEEIPRKPAG
ncbi:E3 ubiquitin-protein ligase TRIM7 [Columba livia]